MTVVKIRQYLVVILIGLKTTLYDQKTEEMKLSDTKNDGGKNKTVFGGYFGRTYNNSFMIRKQRK